MLKSFFKKALFASLLAATASVAFAGKVLIKPIPFPTGTGEIGGVSGAPGGVFGLITLRGYRTTTDGTNSYQSGQAEHPRLDGWLSKADSNGTAVWTKSMNSIVYNSPYASAIYGSDFNRGFVVNDIIFADGSLYVCGATRPVIPSDHPGFGYVARLNGNGDLLDFTLMDTGNLGSRATAICAIVRPDGVRVGVVGDFQGTSIGLLPRVGTGTTANPNISPMIGRMDTGDNSGVQSVRDVFAYTFEKELGIVRRSFTLGFNKANDYASAVAIDGEGDLIVAMTFENPDGMKADHDQRHIDDDRFLHHTGGSVSLNQFNFPLPYDFSAGDWSMIVKVSGDTANARVSAAAVPTLVGTGESGSNSHVTDMIVDSGQLYITGQWSQKLRPWSGTTNASNVATETGFGYWDSNSGTKDIFVAKLDISSLSWQKLAFLSSGGNDEPTQLVAGADGIYVCGSAASTLSHVAPTLNQNYSGTAVGLTGSSARHNFWTKLGKTNLEKLWHITPYENTGAGVGLAPAIYSTGYSAGLSFAGENILLTADNASYAPEFAAPSITQSFGNASNFATTVHNTATFGFRAGGGAFNVLLKPDGTYLEEVSVIVNSAYGNPVNAVSGASFSGIQKVPAGQTIKLTVAAEVYENLAGQVLDASNAELIRTQAVTRRICEGYQFRSSTVNGTSNQVEFVATTDTEMTFHWRTEHAVEIKSDLVAGLTTVAAGTPSPIVNKHWYAAGSPIAAQIDGAYTNLSEPGVRYRSTGYTATGPAIPAGGTSGAFVPWARFENRQQITQFTLTGPVTLAWQWQKEINLRVSTLPASAAGAATATAGGVTGTGDGEFWFPPGSSVVLTSPALRDSGRQTLLRYSNATGSVIPSDQTAEDGVLSKTITLTTQSSIVWNYGKTPVRQRVTIGDFAVWTGMPASVINTQPVGVTVISDAPAGTTPNDAYAWEPAGRRILPLRPGKYLLEFNDPAVDVANTSTEDNVTMQITAGYQGFPVPKSNPAENFVPAADAATYQTYVADSPAVSLDTSTTDGVAWRPTYAIAGSGIQGLALTGGNAAVNGAGGFSASEPGTCVLVFSQAPAGNVARGNLESESLFLRVVKIRVWTEVRTADTATVGTAIAPPVTHDLSVIGHDGYVWTSKAPYNITLHDNATLQGPIFPVNTAITTELANKLIVAWFNRDATLSTNWPSSTKEYTVSWPTPKTRIVIASRLGSEGKDSDGIEQTSFTAGRYSNLAIYNQPDKALPGYNPNEEHALLAPSFLDASRQAVFALQNSLNITTAGATYTSQPFVLAQYTDTTGTPAVSTPKMAVFKVEFEDAATTDTRLPAYNQTYTPKYQIEAGKILTPPWPLPILYGATPWPSENVITSQDANQRSAWQDRKKQWWAVSGDTDPATEVEGQFFYPIRADFFHASKATGENLTVLNDAARKFFFNTVWPATIPVLKSGETITHSGGEAFSDGKTPNGLPSVVGMASAEIVYDHVNKKLDPATIATSWVARVVNPLAPVEVDLPLADVPDSLKPASGNLIVDGLLWRYKKLNAGMQQRLYYDPQRGKLGFRGYLNGRLLGDRELTSAPPAINLLQPNIMTAAEKVNATAVDEDTKWTAAVDKLFKKSRDPVDETTDFKVGLKKVGSNLVPADLGGPGMAIIANPELANPNNTPTITNDGYFTFAENNADTLGDAPIALHIVKLDRTQKYRGAIAPIYPENVFDEKITLRHNGDFGGNVGNLVFEWFYREEDGTNANPPDVAFPSPPGAPLPGRWTTFGESGNEISLAGASAALLADNLFFCRWKYKEIPPATPTPIQDTYSDYAGAANSRPPVVGSPSIATDAAYVPQLAEGWVKRVTNAVNAFDARIRDFRNNSAPSTAVSMLQQAGGRWEGNVAFNPAKDVIENYGLIELYQTVLNRAADLSINLQPGTSGVNTALLNAANRIASLYTLLGNEAYSDSLDPTIGFGTASAQYGNLAPSIFAFQNQTGNLLEEELALLRGRGEIGARPAYNRLLWNFTNGQGEAAYAMNYGITDMTNDGFLDANDAARLYPQGHGDAWGHYTMALRGYATLFRQANFAWDTRSEKLQINGVVFDIDYMDERAFAETAAARAKAGTEIVDMVYRQKFTDNPAGQWQGYQDTNTDRAWGVYESAQRAATGALFDWVTANALLPAKDETKEGITRVDRTTVGALKELATNAAAVQSKLDMADNALNPLGLDSETVPFDIDPVRTDRNSVAPATHFEQIYERAIGAAQNATAAFNNANNLSQMLRRTGGSAEELRQQTIDQDLDYRNRLIEILGTPYQGQIGTGKAYPAGYTGPDLYLHMYVDQTEIDLVKTADARAKEEIQMPVLLKGVMTLATDTNPFDSAANVTPNYAKDSITNWFPKDYNKNILEVGGSPFYEFSVPARTSGYAFKAPAEWGVRASPGKAQAALADLLMAQYDLLLATEGYEGYIDDFGRKMKVFTAKTNLAAKDIKFVTDAANEIETLLIFKTSLDIAANVLVHVRENTRDVFDAIAGGIPDDFTNVGAPFKAAVLSVKAGTSTWQRVAQAIAETASAGFDFAAGSVERQLTIDQTKIAYQAEVIDMLEDLEAHVNTEPDYRLGIFQATERLRSAGERYRATLQEGLRLIEEREAFNKRVASRTTQQRYEDYTFRIARNDALSKYRSTFDLAARYAWLASKAYAYELNLPENHAASSMPVSASILRSRTLGRFENGVPVVGNGGLADQLAMLKGNFDVFKGQLGFNNPASQVVNFSLRAELGRVGLSSRVNADWRTQLETYRVADIWNYTYSKDGVDYGQIFRRYCRPFAPESAGAQPALVIPFGSTITSGQNWFGKTLSGGDSAFTASNFATKIRATGVKFDSYNSTAMSVTPQVYLVPIGLDRMYLPESNLLEARSWRVLDQRIPAPLAISPAQLADSGWQPFTGSTSGYFEEARRYPAFRAYHDAGGYSQAEMLHSSRLVGRSVWNTQWVLIIPSNAILSDPANGAYPGDADAGLDTFIYGAPLPGFTHATAGTTNRDGSGVRDVRLLLQTYSLSGN